MQQPDEKAVKIPRMEPADGMVVGAEASKRRPQGVGDAKCADLQRAMGSCQGLRHTALSQHPLFLHCSLRCREADHLPKNMGAGPPLKCDAEPLMPPAMADGRGHTHPKGGAGRSAGGLPARTGAVP